MTWLKIKFAAGVTATALLVGGATTVAISQTGNQANPPAALTLKIQPQILIRALFIKGTDETLAAIAKEIPTIQETAMDPKSKALRAVVEKHRDAEIISAPSVLTANGRQAVVTTGKEVLIGRTNAHVGLTLDVTPTLQPGPVIHLKLKAQSSELTKGTALSVVSTVTEVSMPPDVLVLIPVENSTPTTAGSTQKKLHLCLMAFEVGPDGNPVPRKPRAAPAPIPPPPPK